jgi:hypothetical protein
MQRGLEEARFVGGLDDAWIEASSANTGSSPTTSSGFNVRARVMPMRWHRLPENSCGKALTISGRRPIRRDPLPSFRNPAHAMDDQRGVSARHGRATTRVEAMNRGLAQNLGPTTELMERPLLAETYAELQRPQDAPWERTVAMRSPHSLTQSGSPSNSVRRKRLATCSTG